MFPKEYEQKFKTWMGNWTGNTNRKSTTTGKNDETKEKRWNMLWRKEESKLTSKTSDKTRGNKSEGTGEKSKTKKILRKDQTIETKQVIPKQRKKIILASWDTKTSQQLDDKKANNFCGKYENAENIIEKPIKQNWKRVRSTWRRS